MIVPQINDNVRKLLLDSQFVEFVLDASDEASYKSCMGFLCQTLAG